MNQSAKQLALGLLLAALVASAGCNPLQNASTPTDTVHLVNQDETAHAVVVEVHRGEELVYSAGRTMDAETDATLGSFDGDGEYRVSVTVDGETTARFYTFPSDDSATTFGIDNQGTVTIST